MWWSNTHKVIMQSNKKESFKLLQLSDDSKSLSDLELPELTHQRKRKILRKTRNTSPHSRHGHGHESPTSDGLITGACTNFGLWIAIVMSCGWLFILSYMTAVVYTENRRLEIQVSQLAVTSKIIPDELQQWHETSKFIEQNQTAISTKFLELDQRLIDLERELKIVRAELAKQNDETEGTKFNILQNSVANFGARIKNLDVEVDSLKEHKRLMLLFEKETKDNITELEQHIIQNGSGINVTDMLSNATIIRLVHNLTDTYGEQLRILSDRLVKINDTLSQQVKGIDDDIREHKSKIDELTDNYANMISHVTSIENDLVKLKAIWIKNPNIVGDVSVAPIVATPPLPVSIKSEDKTPTPAKVPSS